MLQSMAGGTGAGLGTYIAEAIRSNFPSSFLMNHCIWYVQGVQHTETQLSNCTAQSPGRRASCHVVLLHCLKCRQVQAKTIFTCDPGM